MGARIRTPEVSIVALEKLEQAAEGVGLSKAEIREVALGRTQPLPDERKIAVDALARAWAFAVRTTRRPTLTLEAATQYTPSDYHLLGIVGASASTVREGLDQIARYVRVWIGGASWEIVGGDPMMLRYRIASKEADLGVRCIIESGMAEIVNAGRVASGGTIPLRSVHFAHELPEGVGAFEDFFGCPVLTGQAQNAIWVDRNALDVPLPNANPTLKAYFDERARYVLESRGQAKTPLGRVREAMTNAVRSGDVDAKTIAKRVGFSTRTMRRRLDEAGTNFRRLLDETRADLARAYVEDRALSFRDIAFALGFSDKTAFFRSFRRWTGTTPKAYRENAELRVLGTYGRMKTDPPRSGTMPKADRAAESTVVPVPAPSSAA